MGKNLHEEIVYSTDIRLLDSPAFRDCILHIVANAGSAKFIYNGVPFAVAPGDIAVIAHPRLVSAIEPTPDFECEFVAAPETFLHNLLPANNYAIQGCVSLFDNPVMRVSAEDADTFRRDLTNIRDRALDVTHNFYRDMIGSLLRTMVYDLFDFHIKERESALTTDRVGYITSQFFALIQSGLPQTEREVSYYADRLHVTPKYLSETIKRVSGAGASAHINRAAAAIILDYLNNTTLSITQIADEMQFASVSYFSRYCTKHVGLSPREVRTSKGGV